LLPSPRGPRILIYHQVGADLARQMEVTVEDFIWQLDWLVRNRRVVDLELAVTEWDSAGSEDLVVLTFDDGYEDTYTTAFPLLLERGLPFVLYLATEPIETGASLGSGEGAIPLTWDMISEMMASGLVTIGAHTHTHKDLRAASEEEALEEIEVSNQLIEDRLGETPRHFAYPWGYWSERAHPTVTRTYETAVLGGSPRPRPHPPMHQIHRYPVQLSDGTRFFEARLQGGLRMEELARRRLRGYRGP